MKQHSFYLDEDLDSLFGSPPPSPARGRSPPQETLITEGEISPIVAVSSTGVGRKNVGTIALPGSHMSCAELPADLPVSSLSQKSGLPGVVPPRIVGTLSSVRTPVATSRSSTPFVLSRPSSAPGTIPSTSTTTRRRRIPKSKSLTPSSPVPRITLPGPNEPTPTNFLRSQSSLLGLAGLVGCVKPAQLYTHCPQSIPVQHSRLHSPIRGSTPTHPIVLDDAQDTPHIGKSSCGQLQMPQHLDQVDPVILRSNIMNSIAKEKNIFPVLESLIKLFGGEPHTSLANPPPQPFARPYGHGIFNAQPSSVTPLPDRVAPTTPTVPAPKRRKLKHVPAGAVDWDVPFPFAAGEGPKAYRDTWARDRAKQLVTQLLELIQNAAKRAAIKTAKSGEKVSKERAIAPNHRSSRSVSVEKQASQINSIPANIHEFSLHTRPNTAAGIPMDNLSDHLGSFEISNTIGSLPSGSKDSPSVDPEGVVEESGSVAPSDYSAFEEWWSQLQQFVPLEPNALTPESDWSAHPSAASSPAPDIHVPTRHAIQDEAIDPALFAVSQQSASAPQSRSSRSPTSALALDDIPQVFDTLPTPVLAYSPRTSLSSLTEPLTPHSEAFGDAPTSIIAPQDPFRQPTCQPVSQDQASRSVNRVEPMALSSLTKPSESPRATAAQKGKARADGSVSTAATLSASSRSTPSAVSTSNGALDKQAVLERVLECRKQLVAEIERAKMEIWETTIENAVLVHFTRDRSL